MTAPRTAAGRALLADPASGGVPGKTWQDGWRQTICTIEAEAFEMGLEAWAGGAEAAAPYRTALERLVTEGVMPWEAYTPPVYIPPENVRLRAKYREALAEARELLRREVGE